MDFLKNYNSYKQIIDNRLIKTINNRSPKSIYQPIKYILEAGGKRIRPILTMFTCEVVSGKKESALPAALAIEMLHTFTLVHDDIMDNAPTRRGKKTLHEKWDVSTAILAGDELVALSYNELLKTKSDRIKKIAEVFTNGVSRVCDGQALDKEFELRADVTIPEYLKMIDLKTGSMVATATEIGGLIGGGSLQQINALRKFGEHIGRAFQIQDDLLDVIGTKNIFGKKIGNDIASAKKTYLFLHALEQAKGKDKQFLKSIIKQNGTHFKNVNRVKEIYKKMGTIDSTFKLIDKEISKANLVLSKFKNSEAREMLFWFTTMLHKRKF